MVFGGRNCTGFPVPAYLSFLTASVSFVLFLLTSAGNLLVCLAVYRDPNRELRTPFNFFVVNLAFADLLVGLVLEPISVAIHLKEGLTDGPLGNGIPTIHMSYFISCTASVLSLAALTIDRYIAITCPFYYRANASAKKVAVTSLVIWIVSTAMAFVYLTVGYVCYSFVFVNTAVILTLLVLLSSYANIFRALRRHFHVSIGLQAGMNEARAARAARRVEEHEARIIKTFFLVLVMYLLCYTPSCVMIYVLNLCTTCSCYSICWLRDMEFVFVLLNSCLNPFLYAWRLPNFRKAFAMITRLVPRKTRRPRGARPKAYVLNCPITAADKTKCTPNTYVQKEKHSDVRTEKKTLNNCTLELVPWCSAADHKGTRAGSKYVLAETCV